MDHSFEGEHPLVFCVRNLYDELTAHFNIQALLFTNSTLFSFIYPKVLSNEETWKRKIPNSFITQFLYYELKKGTAINLPVLVKSGADINNPRLIHYAVTLGSTELIEALLDLGANPRAYMFKPLVDTAAFGGSRGIVELIVTRLLPPESTVEVVDAVMQLGKTKSFSLIEAYARQNPPHNIELLKHLIALGGDIDQLSKDGLAPLHVAVKTGNIELVEILLQLAKVTKLTSSGILPIDFAAQQGNLKMLEFLLSGYKDFTTRCGPIPRLSSELLAIGSGMDAPSLLWNASKQGKTELISVLLDLGAALEYKFPAPGRAVIDTDFHPVYPETKVVSDSKWRYGTTPLSAALNEQHAETARILLANGANLSSRDTLLNTPLHVASYFGMTSIVQEIMTTSPQKLNEQGYYPLDLALLRGHLETAQLLMGRTGIPNRVFFRTCHRGHLNTLKFMLEKTNQYNILQKSPVKWYNCTFLHIAIWRKYMAIAEYILEKNADINAIAKRSFTPLHCAVQAENYEAVPLLLRHGADINSVINTYRRIGTPLHLAVGNKCHKMVRLLVELGADVNLSDDSKRTPLYVAIGTGDMEMVQLLLSHGAETKGTNEQTPLLHSAVTVKSATMVRYLVEELKVDLEATDRDGYTALALAVDKNDIDMLQLLVAYGAKVEACLYPLKASYISAPMSALHKAVKNANIECVKYLLTRGIDPNSRDSNTNTLLHVATLSTQAIPMVQMLLEHGANINAKIEGTLAGFSVLHSAARLRSTELLEFLLDKGALVENEESKGGSSLFFSMYNGVPAAAKLLHSRYNWEGNTSTTMYIGGLQHNFDRQKIENVLLDFNPLSVIVLRKWQLGTNNAFVDFRSTEDLRRASQLPELANLVVLTSPRAWVEDQWTKKWRDIYY